MKTSFQKIAAHKIPAIFNKSDIFYSPCLLIQCYSYFMFPFTSYPRNQCWPSLQNILEWICSFEIVCLLQLEAVTHWQNNLLHQFQCAVQFQVQAQIHKMAHRSTTLRHLGPQNYTALLIMYLHVCANFQPNWRSRVQILCGNEKHLLGSIFTFRCNKLWHLRGWSI